MKIHDIKPQELVEKASEALKKVESIKPPEWAFFVKTGRSRERPPMDKNWWYSRSASVLRKISVYGPIGVQKLRVKYGGKKNRGAKPEKFYKGSGNIIRKILQQLEKAELIKQTNIKGHKGRAITPKGTAFLNKVTKK